MSSFTSSSSPTSIVTPFPSSIDEKDHHVDHEEEIFTLTPSSYHINLEDLIELLPDTIRKCNSSAQCKYVNNDIRGENSWSHVDSRSRNDPIASLFRRLTISKEELKPYFFIDEKKNYTRNLIATDNETFTLLLLCWNPGKYSPIHDHPCNGCWMRVCQGEVNEVRFKKMHDILENEVIVTEGEKEAAVLQQKNTISSQFVCTMDTVFHEGDQTFINDNIGYHKVGNPGEKLAVSMHLYSPPFDKCKIWMDQCDASACSVSSMCNYSEFGYRVRN